MAFLAGRMIWEFGYRRSKMEKIYRRIRTVYTTANTDRVRRIFTKGRFIRRIVDRPWIT